MKNILSKLSFRFGLKHPMTYILPAVMGLLCVWCAYTATNDDVSSFIEPLCCLALLMLSALLSVIKIEPAENFIKKNPAVLLPLFSVGAFFQMELSIVNPFNRMSPIGYIWGIIIALCVYLVLYALLGRIWLAGIVGNIAFFIFSLISYFTLLFRGLPLIPSDIFSAGTAMNVLGNYELKMSDQIFLILAIFIFTMILSLIARVKIERRSVRQSLLLRVSAIAPAVLWINFACLGTLPRKAGFVLSEWNWESTYYYQGFLETTMLKAEKLVYHPPVGYTDKKAMDLLATVKTNDKTESERPNIVMIVNESWFDLSRIYDFETNREITPFIDNLKNTVRGHTINPYFASGTSTSEYEILTSNSTSLVPGMTPFTQMNLSNTNSIVKHLEELGYTSSAFHPATGENYNRLSVYPKLGFDKSYFWTWDDDTIIDAGLIKEPKDIHGGFSDRSCFEVVKNMFEQRDKDKPAFIYNLTYQNHGGFNQASFNGGKWEVDEENRVYITSDFNEDTKGTVEEYLSSLTYTDDAFKELVEYFEQVEEPVIVCMVGDHAPALGNVAESSYEGLEYQLRSRGTPFIIWANYPIEEKDLGDIGMISLVPNLLNEAGIELSPHYRAILEMDEDIEILSRDFYIHENGDGICNFSEEDVEIDSVRRYLYFANNVMSMSAEKIEDIFKPYK